MRRWIVGVCLCAVFAGAAVLAQTDQAAKANAIFNEGRRVEALPLYEELAKANPKEWFYAERLANCLAAAALQTSDPAEVKVFRMREREAAKRAIELGDTAEYVKLMADADPDVPLFDSISGPGKALLAEAEKAYSAGDFPRALEKYADSWQADPRLYEAALFAGDTAFAQHDLPTAAKWFARAIAIDPDRETAYRYWGDAILRYGNDPEAARDKFIDAIVAEPYNRLAQQGLRQWAQTEKAVILPPKVELPAGPAVDPKNPKNITINIDPVATDEKKHPGASAWLMYSLIRASYHGDLFKKEFPNEKEYRHSLREEDAAESAVVASVKEKKIKTEDLDESLRNLVQLSDAGMLDCAILISGADEGISRDYDAYRKQHRKLLHDYIARFVVHGGVRPAE